MAERQDTESGVFSIVVDTKEMREMGAILRDAFAGNIPPDVLSEFRALLFDLFFRNGDTAVRTDGTNQVKIIARCRRDVSESLVAAFRTADSEVIHACFRRFRSDLRRVA
jgi:hypothetical protein